MKRSAAVDDTSRREWEAMGSVVEEWGGEDGAEALPIPLGPVHLPP